MLRNHFDKNFAYVRLVRAVVSDGSPAPHMQPSSSCQAGSGWFSPIWAVLIHGSQGCFCPKLPATLFPPGDRIPRRGLEAHRPAAKAHMHGGQYQFERACPLGAFSEITHGPIRRVWGEGKDGAVEARLPNMAQGTYSMFSGLFPVRAFYGSFARSSAY
jgi:hypothetical protein